MAANVDSMFYVRTAPWHGLGVRVEESLTSEDALITAGLNWVVKQEEIMTLDLKEIQGYKANIREDTGAVLGVVTDRYRIVQNEEAFAFTDSLISHGVTYETAGSLSGGKRVWILAKLPEAYTLADEKVDPYIIFSNSHDGTGAIKAAMTPVRVVCSNTLNLALNDAKRIWSTIHTGDIRQKLDEARSTLLMAGQYMGALSREADVLSLIKLADKKVMQFINELIRMPDEPTDIQRANITRLRSDITHRYFDAPDLKLLPKNGWRFINAISDFATHAEPLRKTAKYSENLFAKTMDGHPLIDKGLTMVKAA
jgi:phage/plasmid-like protein (TIGR03299 family)